MSDAPDYGPRDFVKPTSCMDPSIPDFVKDGVYIVEGFRNVAGWHTCSVCGKKTNMGVRILGFIDGPSDSGFFPCKFRKLDPTTDLPQSTTTKKKVTP